MCNTRDVHKRIVLLDACIILYNNSFMRAFIGIYHNHLWFSFLGNRRWFGRKNEVMLDGFNDLIALDDMDCKSNLAFPTEQQGRKAHVLPSWILIEYLFREYLVIVCDYSGMHGWLFRMYSSIFEYIRVFSSRTVRRSGEQSLTRTI